MAQEVDANEGHAVLAWALPGEDAHGGETFEMEQAPDPEFRDSRLHHRGTENRIFVSGLRDGPTYFRVRAVEGERRGPWSETLTVHVAYPDRRRVQRLFALGCMVFLATVGAILHGWRGAR